VDNRFALLAELTTKPKSQLRTGRVSGSSVAPRQVDWANILLFLVKKSPKGDFFSEKVFYSDTPAVSARSKDFVDFYQEWFAMSAPSGGFWSRVLDYNQIVGWTKLRRPSASASSLRFR
jgi:hypothetical protein